MKHIFTGFNLIGAVALLALAVGCTSTSTPPQKKQATPHWDSVPREYSGGVLPGEKSADLRMHTRDRLNFMNPSIA
jgi:hypothetical protein